MSRRCTFTYLDSHYDPPEKATRDELDDVMAALLVECFVRDFAIGEKDLTPARLIDHLSQLDGAFSDPAERPAARNLDHYIEAQVHGDVLLDRDVELLVADPSFRSTPMEALFGELCERYPIDLYWRCGFALEPARVPDDFRGPTMRSLAERITTGARFDAAAIGSAALALKRDPEAWADRGSYAEVLQELKLLWHVLVKFGRPAF